MVAINEQRVLPAYVCVAIDEHTGEVVAWVYYRGRNAADVVIEVSRLITQHEIYEKHGDLRILASLVTNNVPKPEYFNRVIHGEELESFAKMTVGELAIMVSGREYEGPAGWKGIV